MFGLKKIFYSGKKPKATHPWKQAAFVAVEEKKAHKRSERDWRASIVASRDRMGVKA